MSGNDNEDAGHSGIVPGHHEDDMDKLVEMMKDPALAPAFMESIKQAVRPHSGEKP